MKTSLYSKYRSVNNIYRTVSVILFVLLILGSVYLIYNSKKLSDNVDRERLDNETLISEKIHLIRRLDEVQKEVAVANEKNRDVIQILDSTKARADEKQKELRRLTLHLDSLFIYRKKCDDLQSNNRDLEKKIFELINK